MPEPIGAVSASYMGASPRVAGPLAYAGRGAAVLGRATIGRDAWLGECSVVRADGHDIRIGDDVHLGRHATVHIAHEVYPTRIGDRVTAGERAVIHACEVGDDCVVDRRAVVLDGSKIGPGAILSADAVVYPRSELEGGWLYAGNPAKPVARVTGPELEAHHVRLRSARAAGRDGAVAAEAVQRTGLDCFVAPTAVVAGDVQAGEGAGVWYGCLLDAGKRRIAIGAGTNIQDNSVIRCAQGEVAIGPDVTIGHNVTMTDCRIEADSLIGIGALIAPGVVVERGVLVAAGAETEVGQRLTAGLVWAGRPARPIGEMDARKRAMLAEILPVYRDYASRFRKTPHAALTSEKEE